MNCWVTPGAARASVATLHCFRFVCSCRVLIDNAHRHAITLKLSGHRQPNRSRPKHQYIHPCLHRDPPLRLKLKQTRNGGYTHPFCNLQPRKRRENLMFRYRSHSEQIPALDSGSGDFLLPMGSPVARLHLSTCTVIHWVSCLSECSGSSPSLHQSCQSLSMVRSADRV
jgi:hypothetical protein